MTAVKAGLDQQRLEEVHRLLHGAGGDKHLGDEDLIALEALADVVHTADQCIEDGCGADAGGDRVLGVPAGVVAVAFPDRFGERGQIHDASPVCADTVAQQAGQNMYWPLNLLYFYARAGIGRAGRGNAGGKRGSDGFDP